LNDPKSDPHSLPDLPLFPLQSVLFPGAQLTLRVFEARYLDLVSRCLREQQPFGAICLRQGSEVRGGSDDAVLLETTGVLARLEEVDAEQAGVLRVRCLGTQRFEIDEPVQQPDGLCVRSPTPSARWSARAARRFSSPTASTTPGGSPTAGASCCRFRWRPNKS
jgi:Lon protease-like protein